VQQGQALKSDVVIYTDMPTFMLLMPGQLEPRTAIAQGRVCIEGDPTALDRLLQMCGLPGGHTPA
jgi:putative sterol carrier protein